MPEKMHTDPIYRTVKLLDLKGKENVGIHIKISGQRKKHMRKTIRFPSDFPYQHSILRAAEQRKYIEKIKALSKNFTAGQYEYTESRK